MQNAYQSNPRNKLVAEAFCLTKRIEKYGSGISRIQQELASYLHIQFCIEEIANGILVSFKKMQKTTVTFSVAGVTGEVMGLISACDGEKSRNELQQLLGLKHEGYFRSSYLLPASSGDDQAGNAQNRLHRYRLTQKGKQVVGSNWNRRCTQINVEKKYKDAQCFNVLYTRIGFYRFYRRVRRLNNGFRTDE